LYRYDTHVHTSETSSCCHVRGEEAARFYKKADYSGIVITDHYYEEFFNGVECSSWNDKIEEFLHLSVCLIYNLMRRRMTNVFC
jgi:hypothetical protein